MVNKSKGLDYEPIIPVVLKKHRVGKQFRITRNHQARYDS